MLRPSLQSMGTVRPRAQRLRQGRMWQWLPETWRCREGPCRCSWQGRAPDGRGAGAGPSDVGTIPRRRYKSLAVVCRSYDLFLYKKRAHMGRLGLKKKKGLRPVLDSGGGGEPLKVFQQDVYFRMIVLVEGIEQASEDRERPVVAQSSVLWLATSSRGELMMDGTGMGWWPGRWKEVFQLSCTRRLIGETET